MIYLIIGRTGSGKDYLAQKLVENGLRQVKSYATRPKRTDSEDTHIFITPDEAHTYIDKVATTNINGYEYFATKQQIESSDIYVIDPKGMQELVTNMPDTEFQIIYMKSDDFERRVHAIKRAEDKIKEEEIFAQRDEAENAQFTEFENKIDKIETEIVFPENVDSVIVIHNDYKKDTINKYVKQLISYKTLCQKMISIVSECIDMGIIPSGNTKDTAMLSYTTENGTIQKEKTKTHCAVRLLGDCEGFYNVMTQWLLQHSADKERIYTD